MQRDWRFGVTVHPDSIAAAEGERLVTLPLGTDLEVDVYTLPPVVTPAPAEETEASRSARK